MALQKVVVIYVANTIFTSDWSTVIEPKPVGEVFCDSITVWSKLTLKDVRHGVKLACEKHKLEMGRMSVLGNHKISDQCGRIFTN